MKKNQQEALGRDRVLARVLSENLKKVAGGVLSCDITGGSGLGDITNLAGDNDGPLNRDI
jgi:hypothetical protein